jgi:hypothetical protein
MSKKVTLFFLQAVSVTSPLRFPLFHSSASCVCLSVSWGEACLPAPHIHCCQLHLRHLPKRLQTLTIFVFYFPWRNSPVQTRASAASLLRSLSRSLSLSLSLTHTHTHTHTHKHTRAIELLCTSDQPVTQAATYTTQQTNIHAFSETGTSNRAAISHGWLSRWASDSLNSNKPGDISLCSNTSFSTCKIYITFRLKLF